MTRPTSESDAELVRYDTPAQCAALSILLQACFEKRRRIRIITNNDRICIYDKDRREQIEPDYCEKSVNPTPSPKEVLTCILNRIGMDDLVAHFRETSFASPKRAFCHPRRTTWISTYTYETGKIRSLVTLRVLEPRACELEFSHDPSPLIWWIAIRRAGLRRLWLRFTRPRSGICSWA